MKGGLKDYNNTEVADWTWDHPDGDLTPFDYIWMANKNFWCNPGEC